MSVESYLRKVDELSNRDAEELLWCRRDPRTYGPAMAAAFQQRVDEEGCGAVIAALDQARKKREAENKQILQADLASH